MKDKYCLEKNMRSKTISIIPIDTFSISLLSVAMPNKARREEILIKAFGITTLAILILMSIANAAPFADITNYDSTTVIDTATNKESI
ncbi:hypothetical protein [Methanosarcina horonobensis]|uniref:hypothetical protein n=1 Tax=Methanosarcina horonobensis TaxID=418008 RepID=UPI00064EBD11|nr:hypothetical protein [Methanosarcina horonobensis]